MTFEYSIVGIGGSAVVVRDAENDPSFVYKVYLTNYSMWSYEQETREKLLHVLRKADPNQQYFQQPSLDIAQDIRESILNTNGTSIMYAAFMQSSYRKNKITEDNFDKFALMPEKLIKIVRIPQAAPITEGTWTPHHKRQAFLLLTFLHSLHISHKDVHLWNFLTCSDGSLRLIDFGESEWIKTSDDIQQDMKALDEIEINDEI